MIPESKQHLTSAGAVLSSGFGPFDAAALQARLGRVAIGAQMQGRVVGAVQDGSALVELSGAVVRMAIPGGTNVGDRLSLKLLERHPAIKFELIEIDGAPLVSAAAAAKLGSEPRRAEHAGSAASAVQWSQAVRLIQSLLQDGRNEALLQPGSPVVSSPRVPAEQIAAALKEQIVRSGLFYESHVAKWQRGELKLSDLQREPQAQLPALTPAPAGDATQGANLVSSQLAVLEQERFQWLGEVWPGQQAQLEVRREEGGDAGQDAARRAEQRWTGRLRIVLPHAGGVDITLKVEGDRLHAEIEAEEGETARALPGELPGFAEALQRAGTVVGSLRVKHKGAPSDEE